MANQADDRFFDSCRVATKEALYWNRKANLKEMCKQNGLPVSGNKRLLADRLWMHMDKAISEIRHNKATGEFELRITIWHGDGRT